jgi:hypothetical protein
MPPPVAMQDGVVRHDSALSLLLEGDGLNARPRPHGFTEGH